MVKEMTDLLVLELVDKGLVTDQMVLTVGYDVDNLRQDQKKRYRGEVTTDRYGRKIPKHAHGTVNLVRKTSSTHLIMEEVLSLYDDIVNELLPKFEEADGLVVSSPVYYASANATLIAVLDRLFYISRFDKTMKVGASVVSCRRGGASATFDELNKYFTISGMPVVSSQYWNSIHGNNAQEANQDEEGKQTMRVLARNMTFLMKSIALGKEAYGLPEKEIRKGTNFIR